MFVGHIAVGVAIKALFPRTPTKPILIGAGLLDILDGLFVLVGIDHIQANLAAGPYVFFDLSFVDWDHSLLMAALISVLWALLFRKDKTTAWVAGLAVFSHFLGDWPVHNNDLALYPHAIEHLGGGLWGTLGTASWVLEGLFSAALLAFSWVRLRAHGVSLLWPTVALTVSFFNASPWLSPTKFAAQLPEPAPHLLYGVLTTGSFLILGLLLTWLIDRQKPELSTES